MSCFIIKQKEHLKNRDLMDRLSNNVLVFFFKLSNNVWAVPLYESLYKRALSKDTICL